MKQVTITQLYCEKLEKELEEQKEDKKVIFNKIADLRDYIYESDEIEREYILEQLQDMQQYAK